MKQSVSSAQSPEGGPGKCKALANTLCMEDLAEGHTSKLGLHRAPAKGFCLSAAHLSLFCPVGPLLALQAPRLV